MNAPGDISNGLADHEASEALLEKQGGATQVEEPSAVVSRWLPTVLASALFMDLLDSSALGAALPTLAREFNADPLHLKLALTAYLLTMAVFVPVSGWLADRYGARRVFLNAMKVYLLGSLCCGLSSTVPELVAARLLQGLGGAMMTPVARLIVVAATPRERLVQAMNAFTLPAVIAPMLGPLVAGLLLDVASWRWIFFVNLPVGLLGIWAVLRLVPRLRHPYPGPFDGRGFAAVAVAIVCFVALAEMSGMRLAPWPLRAAIAVAGLAAGVLYVVHSGRLERPVLSLRMLRKPTFRASLVGSTIVRLGIGATPFLVPLQLQLGLGWSALRSGMVMTALVLSSIVARFVGTWIVRRFGFRPTLLVTGVLSGLAAAAPALFRPDSSQAEVALVLALVGCTRTIFFVAAAPLTFAEVPAHAVSRASTLSTVVQQLGLSLGVSVAGAALAWSQGNAPVLELDDFVLPNLLIGAASLLTLPVFIGLQRNVADNMRGAS